MISNTSAGIYTLHINMIHCTMLNLLNHIFCSVFYNTVSKKSEKSKRKWLIYKRIVQKIRRQTLFYSNKDTTIRYYYNISI